MSGSAERFGGQDRRGLLDKPLVRTNAHKEIALNMNGSFVIDHKLFWVPSKDTERIQDIMKLFPRLIELKRKNNGYIDEFSIGIVTEPSHGKDRDYTAFSICATYTPKKDGVELKKIEGLKDLTSDMAYTLKLFFPTRSAKRK